MVFILSSILVQCAEKIDIAYKNAQLSISDIDLYVHQHDKFGKGVIKRCGFSPDAFIQMALQLAYYRVSHVVPTSVM